MERRTLESTTASRIKCLYLALVAAKGSEAAQELLEHAGVPEDLLGDETRPVPGKLWYRTLAEFERVLGPSAIEDSFSFFLHHENLGVWTPVLRGTENPQAAFCQLDRLGADQRDDERPISDWKTLDSSRSSWLGAAPLPSLSTEIERVTRARASELRALASLLGCKIAHLSHSHCREEGVTRFEVRWSSPWQKAKVWGPVWGALPGAGAAWALGWQLGGFTGLGVLAGVAGGALAGLGLGALAQQDAQRRGHSASQTFRIRVLERSAELRSRRSSMSSVFEEGTVLAGQFRLRKPIGVGAAGSVWEAERLADGELVALKLLRSALAHDSQAADRLRREADALGLAWHPHVVEVFDHGHLPNGISYIVMERLVGESLAQRLEREKQLNPEELREIALQTCDALDAIHAAGVVHRDIKPSNLFLTRNPDGSLRVKLVDFGVAQVAWAETRLTRSGTPLGTPGYMAPEQEAGRIVDGRSDLFSLGGVLYQALVGRPPPIPKASVDGSPLQWIDLEPVEAGWRSILERLLAPWPNQRFSDARALRDALRSLGAAPRTERDTA